MNKKPELMSPIKNWTSLRACKKYADAVYFSASNMSLRAGANNITLDELGEFVNECHKNNIKSYLTVNSVVYNQDIKKVKDVIKKAKENNVDAVIVWDPATIEIAKEIGIDFFISTQANVSNYKAANFYKNIGAKRVILAREMTLKQIKEVRKKTDIELEAFIHGAMCLAISGRCILSAYFENKSANKGACYQLCRRKWKLIDDDGNAVETDGKYFLNPKDICMIEYIPEMIEAGINSFKIEGRQRNPNYIETTAKYYRKAIDAYYEDDFTKERAQKWKKELKKVYNREFSTGFYFGTPSAEGINFNNSGSAATTKRKQIGIVTHYYPKSKAAAVKLEHRDLEVGETITIEGENTYLKQRVDSIQLNKKNIQKAKKGSSIGIKVKKRVRKNDKIFVILD
ncbi:MAG: peptidase U32 family protein [Minisyncoccales bacterium]